jgi:hypothetical protein
MANVSELDCFIDESIRLSRAKGYYPTTFEGMRERWGTNEAIRRLVISGDIQSGFRRMVKEGLLAWSLESAVINFPREFDQTAHQAANGAYTPRPRQRTPARNWVNSGHVR